MTKLIVVFFFAIFRQRLKMHSIILHFFYHPDDVVSCSPLTTVS